MKKRNFILGFLFAILTAFTFGLKFNNTAKTYAAGVFTISFDANQGTCSTTSQQTTSDGTLSSLPTPSRTDYVFDCWINGDTPVTTSTVFSEDTTVVARYQMKNFEYHISKPDSNYSIIGKTLNADFDYTLSNTCSSLENAIDLIKSDLSDDSKQVTLNFNNISLEKNLELNFKII